MVEDVGESEAEFIGKHELGRVRILLGRGVAPPGGGQAWVEKVILTDTPEVQPIAIKVYNRLSDSADEPPAGT